MTVDTNETEAQDFAVKVKLAGKNRYDFLTSSGGTTHLRIHAAMWNEQGAQEMARLIVIDNPDAVEDARAVDLR